jgi:predicted tellurium resistance membrane protein TerC
MELFSTPWWSALLAIILIDLVLAGDNAIVIALAARNLPKHLQKKRLPGVLLAQLLSVR